MANSNLLSKYYKYDYYIILLIGLLSFGLIGGSLQPVRLYGILFFPYVIRRILSWKIKKIQRWISLFFGSWFLYMLFSLLWTPDKIQGTKELLYYLMHFNLFFLLLFWTEKARNPINSIIKGWILVLLLTLPIALYEVITFNHLPMSRFDENKYINLGGLIENHRFASVTFSNSNTFVVLMCFCLPFLLSKLLFQMRLFYKIFLWVVLFIASFIIFVNSSRGGIITLFISLIMFLYFKFKLRDGNSLVRKLFTFSFIFICIVFIFQNYLLDFFSNSLYRFGEAGRSFTDDAVRFDLYSHQLEIVAESYFLGTGVGSINSALGSLGDLLSPHNLLLEFFVQYGVIFFIFFISFLYKSITQKNGATNITLRYISRTFFLMFTPLFIINSSYLLMPSLWLLFASLYAVSTNPAPLIAYKIVSSSD